MQQPLATTKYVFELEQSPFKKGDCPNCKHKNCFRYYKHLPHEYGICDHANKCSYHHKPSEQAPDIKKELYNMVNNAVPLTEPIQQQKTVVPSEEQLSVLNNHSSVFHAFCTDKLGISKEHLQCWNVGTDNRSNTAFVLQDITGKHIHIKFIEYVLADNNCKRNKNKNPYYLKAQETECYKKCLFGEHLINKDKITCVVESEKTAVICAFKYPQYNWVATGGNNGVKIETLNILKKLQVYYLADNDNAGNNNSILKKLQLSGIDFKQVCFETAKEGEDLADLIIRGEHPDIKPSVVENRPTTELPLYKAQLYKETESFEMYNFFERNNTYYTKIHLKHSTKDIKISNFKMNILSKINDSSDNIPILIELIRHDGKIALYEITSRDLHNPAFFSALIFAGGYNYNSSSYIYKNILESLHDDKNIATYITTLGQQVKQNFYAFCNGILTTNGDFLPCNKLGFVTYNNEAFYIPSAKIGNEENENFTDDVKFKFVNGTLTLDVFIEKMYRIYGINALIGLCYTIATIHRDIIFNETKCFPFLFLNGGKGSGKSTYINFFMNFFGIAQPETTENSTDKAIERKFAQINNSIQYIKEFSPSFEDKITNILKNAYDGTGYSRAQATQNNKTKTITVRSGLVIDGNYFPTKDSALFSRLLFMIWQPKFTDASKELIQELQDLLSKGNGLIFSEIYKKRDYYKSNFSTVYRHTMQDVKNRCRAKKMYFSERETTHIAMMAVVFKLSIQLNEQAYMLFLEFIITGMHTQMQINESIDDVNKFFEGLETLENTAKINNPYYYKRSVGSNYQYLHLNYNASYFEYAKLLKEMGVKQIISSEELKQKLLFVISKDYYFETKKELYTTEKFGNKTARSLVFNVGKDSFDLIK